MFVGWGCGGGLYTEGLACSQTLVVLCLNVSKLLQTETSICAI